jgi:hypothetical protein
MRGASAQTRLKGPEQARFRPDSLHPIGHCNPVKVVGIRPCEVWNPVAAQLPYVLGPQLAAVRDPDGTCQTK